MRTTSLMLLVFAVGTGSAVAASDVSFAGLDTVLTRHLSEGRLDCGAPARDPGLSVISKCCRTAFDERDIA